MYLLSNGELPINRGIVECRQVEPLVHNGHELVRIMYILIETQDT